MSTFWFLKIPFFNSGLDIVFSGELIWTVMDKEWRYGDTMCKVFKFSQTFGLTCSTYLVVAIALDRLWAIVTPLNRLENNKSRKRGHIKPIRLQDCFEGYDYEYEWKYECLDSSNVCRRNFRNWSFNFLNRDEFDSKGMTGSVSIWHYKTMPLLIIDSKLSMSCDN